MVAPRCREKCRPRTRPRARGDATPGARTTRIRAEGTRNLAHCALAAGVGSADLPELRPHLRRRRRPVAVPPIADRADRHPGMNGGPRGHGGAGSPPRAAGASCCGWPGSTARTPPSPATRTAYPVSTGSRANVGPARPTWSPWPSCARSRSAPSGRNGAHSAASTRQACTSAADTASSRARATASSGRPASRQGCFRSIARLPAATTAQIASVAARKSNRSSACCSSGPAGPQLPRAAPRGASAAQEAGSAQRSRSGGGAPATPSGSPGCPARWPAPGSPARPAGAR